MSDDELWGQIDFNKWSQVPHIKERIATEQDVIEGRAVFYINDGGEGHQTLDIPIPSIAYHVDSETNEKTMVVVIQGEQSADKEVIGYRMLDGGNGVCLLWELEVLADKNEIGE
jgi:hypothetical protein